MLTSWLRKCKQLQVGNVFNSKVLSHKKGESMQNEW